jgi:chromate transporter
VLWGDLGPSYRTAGIWLTLWIAPLVALALLLGPDNTFTEIASFFALTATVTFGGAYAVLGWIAEHASQTGWASRAEIAAALALGEATPGPLIQVVQIIGYLGAYRDPGSLHPIVAGVLGALLSVWMTFVPSFLWILTLAPHLDTVRAIAPLRAAIRRISCAVIGVIAHLGLSVAVGALFGGSDPWTFGYLHVAIPMFREFDPWQAAIAALAAVAIFRFHTPHGYVLTFAALAGVLVWTFAR